jgi:hypothetical protein
VFDDAAREAKRKANFLRFIHEVELLNLACDVLIVCAPPKINNDTGCIRHGTGAPFVPTMRVLQWLLEQGLLLRLPNGFYQSGPGAIDELIHRLSHDGDASPGWVDGTATPSPPPADPYAAERQAARDKLNAALAASGYRDKSNRRLRLFGKGPRGIVIDIQLGPVGAAKNTSKTRDLTER